MLHSGCIQISPNVHKPCTARNARNLIQFMDFTGKMQVRHHLYQACRLHQVELWIKSLDNQPASNC